MRALLWTRSVAAREMVALVLSRAGYEAVVARDVAHCIALLDQPARALILGPSFTVDEARAIGAQLSEVGPRLVLLEDLASPLACRVIAEGVNTQVLSLPVRVRPLLDAIG